MGFRQCFFIIVKVFGIVYSSFNILASLVILFGRVVIDFPLSGWWTRWERIVQASVLGITPGMPTRVLKTVEFYTHTSRSLK